VKFEPKSRSDFPNRTFSHGRTPKLRRYLSHHQKPKQMKKPTLRSPYHTGCSRRALPLIVLMALCHFASAQTYSLAEAISAALNNNQQLQNSKLDMNAADYRIKEIKSALLPTIDITGQLLYYNDLPAQYARRLHWAALLVSIPNSH
jgi:hypothetical protein